MKQRNRIFLTGVGEVLKKEVEEKLDTLEEESDENVKCDNGNTKAFYDELGVDLPEDLVEKLEARNKSFSFGDDDYEEVYSDVLIYEDDIKFVLTGETGTIVYLKGNIRIGVLETVEEIDDYLSYYHMSFLEKLLQNIKYMFSKKEE
jgi:hypothetical protein